MCNLWHENVRQMKRRVRQEQKPLMPAHVCENKIRAKKRTSAKNINAKNDHTYIHTNKKKKFLFANWWIWGKKSFPKISLRLTFHTDSKSINHRIGQSRSSNKIECLFSVRSWSNLPQTFINKKSMKLLWTDWTNFANNSTSPWKVKFDEPKFLYPPIDRLWNVKQIVLRIENHFQSNYHYQLKQSKSNRRTSIACKVIACAAIDRNKVTNEVYMRCIYSPHLWRNAVAFSNFSCQQLNIIRLKWNDAYTLVYRMRLGFFSIQKWERERENWSVLFGANFHGFS